MKYIIMQIKSERLKTLYVLCMLFVVSFLQIATSYLQVFSFDKLVQLDFIGYIKIEFVTLCAWILLLALNQHANVKKEKLITLLIYKLREKYVIMILNKNYHEYKEYTASEYAGFLSNDYDVIKNKSFTSSFELFETICLMSLSLVALFTFHYTITILTIMLTLVVTFLPQVLSEKSQQATNGYLASINKYLHNNIDSLNGFNIFVSSGKKNLLSKMLFKNNEKVRHAEIKYAKISGEITVYISLISIASQMILMIFTAFLLSIGIVSLGVIGSVGNIAANVFNSLTKLSSSLMNIKSSEDVFRKYTDIRIISEMKIDEVDKTSFESLKIQGLNISFNNKEILSNMSFEVKKYGKYAIVGESGSGKTSLFNCILGRNSSFDGEILLNGENINEYNSAEISSIVSYAEQDKYLFNTSIKDNLTIFESLSNEKIENAVRMFNIEHLCLEDNVNEISLSEGEKQRIILARTYLLDKDLILIDEGTANLDKKNSNEIEKKLLNCSDKTIVFITHHLNSETTKLYDEILYT